MVTHAKDVEIGVVMDGVRPADPGWSNDTICDSPLVEVRLGHALVFVQGLGPIGVQGVVYMT